MITAKEAKKLAQERSRNFELDIKNLKVFLDDALSRGETFFLVFSDHMIDVVLRRQSYLESLGYTVEKKKALYCQVSWE